MTACTCRTDVEARLLALFVEQAREASGHKVELQGYGMILTDATLKMVPYMAVQCTADFPLKKGGTKPKSKVQSMFFNFCPFCGTSLKEPTS